MIGVEVNKMAAGKNIKEGHVGQLAQPLNKGRMNAPYC